MYPIGEISHNSDAYRQMVALRNDMLRRPLGLVFTQDELAREAQDILIGAFAAPGLPGANRLIGCLVLTPAAGERIQLRQMAVAEDHQLSGLGSALVRFAEARARARGFSQVFLHARLEAVPFYEKLGYQRRGALFTEVTLPHYRMNKALGH